MSKYVALYAVVYIVILGNIMVSFIYVYLHCKVIIINGLPFALNGASALAIDFDEN